jgi:hypothetical protein
MNEPHITGPQAALYLLRTHPRHRRPLSLPRMFNPRHTARRVDFGAVPQVRTPPLCATPPRSRSPPPPPPPPTKPKLTIRILTCITPLFRLPRARAAQHRRVRLPANAASSSTHLATPHSPTALPSPSPPLTIRLCSPAPRRLFTPTHCSATPPSRLASAAAAPFIAAAGSCFSPSISRLLAAFAVFLRSAPVF